MNSTFFAEDLERLYPIIEEGGSDSAAFDNVLELLVINGVMSLPEAIMMMVPEAWQDNADLDPKKAAFYEWAACLMEPWDGPALFTFADGRYCGANLDRNGLRPCRFYVTDDDRIICASEVGTIPIPSEKITQKGRLQPGRMLLVDTLEGRIVDDRELKAQVSSRFDFRSWTEDQLLTMDKIQDALTSSGVKIDHSLDDVRLQSDGRLLAFGYSYEQVTLLLGPMVFSLSSWFCFLFFKFGFCFLFFVFCFLFSGSAFVFCFLFFVFGFGFCFLFFVFCFLFFVFGFGFYFSFFTHTHLGCGFEGSPGLDGQRRSPGLSCQPTSPAVRLLQAIVRPSHEPSNRSHP